MGTYAKYLKFSHFITTPEGTFGSARYNGRIYNFLISGECVRWQHGAGWQILARDVAETIRSLATNIQESVPTYAADSRLFTN